MLVISRKNNETLIINDNIEITILDISKDKVKIGINAPKEVSIARKEIYVTEKENQNAAVSPSEEIIKKLLNNSRKE